MHAYIRFNKGMIFIDVSLNQALLTSTLLRGYLDLRGYKGLLTKGLMIWGYSEPKIIRLSPEVPFLALIELKNGGLLVKNFEGYTKITFLPSISDAWFKAIFQMIPKNLLKNLISRVLIEKLTTSRQLVGIRLW